MDRYECPFPVPEEHLRMVGVIAAQWEWIERTLERAIAGVMEHDYRRVAMFLANISFSDKCDLFLAHGRVFEESQPAEWKEITTAIKGLREARATRNAFVHCTWKQGTEPGASPLRASVRTKGGTLKAEEVPVTTEDMYAAAKEIWNAGRALAALINKYDLITEDENTAEGSEL